MNYDVKELERRKRLAEQARRIILQALPVEDEDESSLMLIYDAFYLQISFSDLHPLLVMYFVRGIDRKITLKDKDLMNRLNQESILGGHTLSTELGCYSYRAAHWLDTGLTEARFLEILSRSLAEAQKGYDKIAG